jgi:CubicO group peptidase (beta-lactamase class C family)
MRWDERVVQIMPGFAVSDPAITARFTVENLVCACTGVPRRDLELVFNGSRLTAPDVIESLRDFEFFTEFGEAFQYSNQLVATGGYVATLAAGGHYDALLADFETQMQRRIFDPIGMANTTFSFDRVRASPSHATPNGASLAGGYAPMPLSSERWVLPLAPSGGVWSNVRDMARYLITELNLGVSPDGRRVVSEENLRATWQPQVSITVDMRYGLGWLIDRYKGVPLIHHGGNTLGFTSDAAFLPDAGLGIVVLTNARASNAFTPAAAARGASR